MTLRFRSTDHCGRKAKSCFGDPTLSPTPLASSPLERLMFPILAATGRGAQVVAPSTVVTHNGKRIADLTSGFQSPCEMLWNHIGLSRGTNKTNSNDPDLKTS